MTSKTRYIMKGFTLVEMLLVIVIVSAIIYMSIGYMQQKSRQMSIDKASLQMQQILNAGLAYYVSNGSWPGGLNTNAGFSCLQGTGAVPCNVQYLTTTFTSPFGVPYGTWVGNGSLFYATLQLAYGTATSGIATTIAGRLPMAYVVVDNTQPPGPTNTCGPSNTTCWIFAAVNIPGQNLNNATAVNFAGLYHHGGCIPVPQCPVDKSGTTMTPEVIVVPVSVSGVNDPSNNANVYPLSSFTAYASNPGLNPGEDPSPCLSGTAAPCAAAKPSASYWRACLQVVTERGDVQVTRSDAWGNAVTLAAFTRCAITNEPSGSDFTVFTH